MSLQMASSDGEKTPQALGGLLAYQFLAQRFEVQLDEVTRDLRPDLRSCAEFWVVIWLGWVFQTMVAATYGDVFRNQMLAVSRGKYAKLDETDGGTTGRDLSRTIDFWFTHLDGLAQDAGTKVGDVEIPVQVFAALRFLALDSESPFYRQPDIPDGIDFDVATVLAKAQESVGPVLRQLVGVKD